MSWKPLLFPCSKPSLTLFLMVSSPQTHHFLSILWALMSLHLLLNVRYAQDTHADWCQTLIKGACIPTSTCQSINYHRFLDTSEHGAFQDMQLKIFRERHTHTDILGIFRAWLKGGECNFCTTRVTKQMQN